MEVVVAGMRVVVVLITVGADVVVVAGNGCHGMSWSVVAGRWWFQLGYIR